MDLDDLDPRKPQAKPKDLLTYSVDDLKAYIDLLKAELARAEKAITQKTVHKSAASSIFKT